MAELLFEEVSSHDVIGFLGVSRKSSALVVDSGWRLRASCQQGCQQGGQLGLTSLGLFPCGRCDLLPVSSGRGFSPGGWIASVGRAFFPAWRAMRTGDPTA